LLALNHFNVLVGVAFLLGITAAAYSSADSALTALTTSFCVDFLNFEHGKMKDNPKVRMSVHLGFSFILFVVILIFSEFSDASVITGLFRVAGYTYGPLLGLFAFGLFTKLQVHDRWVPVLAVVSPIISYVININSQQWFGYTFGFEILILNGFITSLGLWLLSKKKPDQN